MDNIDTTLIGTYIKNIRLSKGWSQAKLEYISGIVEETEKLKQKNLFKKI